MELVNIPVAIGAYAMSGLMYFRFRYYTHKSNLRFGGFLLFNVPLCIILGIGFMPQKQYDFNRFKVINQGLKTTLLQIYENKK